MEEEFEMEEQQLLNLSLSLVSHTNSSNNNNNCELSTASDGSSDGGECTYDRHQSEILRLLQIRHQMLRQDDSRINRDSRKSGAQLIHLLLKSATAIDERTLHSASAISNLTKLYRSASLMGDSAQRLGAYYADGLTAKLLKRERNPLYNTVMKQASQGDEFLAFTHMYRVSPCYQFSHFTANQAILEAFEREQGFNSSQLHVLDFDLAFGLQWPSLIQSLSEKATPESPVSLRITGFGSCLVELVETEARLVSFAKGFGNVAFEFRGVVRGSKLVDQSVVGRRRDETLAVNLVLSYLHASSKAAGDVLRISDALKSVRSLCPSIVVLVQREGAGRDRAEHSSLLGKLMESTLHYYAAMFGSLEDCLPRDSLERLCIERGHLGAELRREVLTAGEFGDDELVSWARYGGLERWRERMEGSGFGGVELSTRTAMQAKLLLRMRSHYHPQFRVVERESGKAISLGWQDRLLITATAWRPV
nr:GRAS transcription factor 25 [Rheum palmatum]